MLLVIDNQGGLRGLVGGERPVEAIAGEVQEGLSDAGSDPDARRARS